VAPKAIRGAPLCGLSAGIRNANRKIRRNSTVDFQSPAPQSALARPPRGGAMNPSAMRQRTCRSAMPVSGSARPFASAGSSTNLLSRRKIKSFHKSFVESIDPYEPIRWMRRKRGANSQMPASAAAKKSRGLEVSAAPKGAARRVNGSTGPSQARNPARDIGPIGLILFRKGAPECRLLVCYDEQMAHNPADRAVEKEMPISEQH
jgi:hypothetical protein